MKFRAKVYEPMYDFNNKKYIRVTIPEHCVDVISKIHNTKRPLLLHENVDDPLEGKVLKLKVPYRYRRVMCDVQGRPVQTLVKGDDVEIDIAFKGAWNIENHSGFSWMLSGCSALS